MQRILLKSKIHRAVITEGDLNYPGSITIDKGLMEKADIVENEKVLVVNINNGARFETYAISDASVPGCICLNGACARLGHPGDIVIIMSFSYCSEEEIKNFKSRIVLVDDKNQVTEIQ